VHRTAPQTAHDGRFFSLEALVWGAHSEGGHNGIYSMLMVQKVHYQPQYVAVFGILQTAHLAASECTSITDC